MNHRLRHQAPNLAHRLKIGACSIAASFLGKTCVHGSFCTTQFPRTVEALTPPSCEFSSYVYGMLLATVFDMLDSWRSFILWAGALAQFHTFRYVFDTLGRRLGAISYLFDMFLYFGPAPGAVLYLFTCFPDSGPTPRRRLIFSIRVLYFGPPP